MSNRILRYFSNVAFSEYMNFKSMNTHYPVSKLVVGIQSFVVKSCKDCSLAFFGIFVGHPVPDRV